MVRHSLVMFLLVMAACSSGRQKEPLLDVGGRFDGRGELTAADMSPEAGPVDGSPAEALTALESAADTLADSSCWDCLPFGYQCWPGKVKCAGDAVTTCAEDGVWSLPVPCLGGEYCEDGLCLPWPEGMCAEALKCMEGLDCPGKDLECLGPCLEGVVPAVAAQLAQIYWCIDSWCQAWKPGSDCFAKERLGKCRQLFEGCTGICEPNCVKKECGPDGCGSDCGQCRPGFGCDANGKCLCQPQCQGKDCGPNGCGAECGVCGLRRPICSEQGLSMPKDEVSCGNGQCEAEKQENCFSCPADCDPCPPCGDGLCEPAEFCEICPADCGPCPYGDCCDYHPFPGCESAEITNCVCAVEPDCCLKSWHYECVTLAKDCGAPCK